MESAQWRRHAPASRATRKSLHREPTLYSHRHGNHEENRHLRRPAGQPTRVDASSSTAGCTATATTAASGSSTCATATASPRSSWTPTRRRSCARVAHELKFEYCIAVEGDGARPARAPWSTRACPPARSRCGAARSCILSRCDVLPFMVDEKSDAKEDTPLQATATSTCARFSMQRKIALRHDGGLRHARVPGAAQGFYEIETPMFIRSHPRGRPRLPRALAAEPGQVLRAAAVAAAVQADPHGLGLRQVLPDRPLLPRRGRPRATGSPSSPRSTSR